MRQIAIYGKGGIDKSTTTQNLAALLDSNTCFTVPTPLTNEELEALLLRFCPV